MMRKFIILFISFFCIFSCNNQVFRDLTGVYEAEFETNGGTNVDSLNAIVIETAPLTTKADCTFLGWYLSGESTKVTFPYTLKENTTFYAKWKSNNSNTDSSKDNAEDKNEENNSNSENTENNSKDNSADTNVITETITYSTNADIPGQYWIKWTNSGKCKMRFPYLYKNGKWFSYPNNGSISLANGTYTFYLADSEGRRISNILTIVVTDSPYSSYWLDQ